MSNFFVPKVQAASSGGPETFGSGTCAVQTSGNNGITVTAETATGDPVLTSVNHGLSLDASNGSNCAINRSNTAESVLYINFTAITGNPQHISFDVRGLTANTTVSLTCTTSPVTTYTYSISANAGTQTISSKSCPTGATGLGSLTFPTGKYVAFIDNISWDNTTVANWSSTSGSAASAAAITTQPIGAASGSTLGTQPVIRIVDGSGNTVTSSTVNVVASIASGSGTLSGTSTVAAVAGIATFTNLVITGTAGAFTLTFTPTSLTPATSNNLTITAGAASKYVVTSSTYSPTAGAAVTITAQLTDASGNAVATSGKTVTWSKSNANGSFASATSTTNASGIATISFTTHTVSATATTVTATDNSSFTGTTPTITTTTGAASQIAINAGNSQSATVATTVSVLPSIIIKDANGNPVSGVSVTFAVASGNGTITGATATTNASGIATVGSWTLGTSAGSNTLTATSAGLTGSPVTFTATATAGAASHLAVNAGNSQSATVATTVSVLPSVSVEDAYNNPVSGVSVTFAVASGGGSITGATTTTNASGIATVGSWTLGTSAGSNTLTATSAGLTGSPVTFTATATSGTPGAPTIGSATSTGTTSATVSFTAPTNNGGAAIVSYRATSSPGGFTGTLTQSGSGTITVSGLSPNTAYIFTVTAYNGTSTSTASSASNSITTNKNVITTAAIAGITSPETGATPVTSTSSNGQYRTTITWSGSPSTFAADTAYTATITIIPESNYTVTGISADFFTVMGAISSNSASGSIVSAMFPAVPIATPGAPTIGSATSTGANTATVSFTAPTNDGGTAITSYTATSSPGGLTGTLLQSGSGTIAVAGLSPNTSYTFTVTAYNGARSSASSASNSITTSIAAPGAPTIGSATSTGTTTATVSFTAPVNNGGAAIVSYTATSSPGGITATLTQSGSGTITVTGLNPNTSYTFTVTAYNGTLTSSASSASNLITTSIDTPGAPIIGTASATGSISATVSFTAPTNNGGAAIVSYTATTSPGGLTATLTQSGSGTITVTGLSPNTSYTFTITANNGTLTSSASSASNSVTTSKTQITTAAISGITAPATGATPITSTTSNGQYSTTITWSGSPSVYAPNIAYTATITIIPESTFTSTGVSANFFTVSGATSVTNDINSGTVTAVFPTTEIVTPSAPTIGTATSTGTTTATISFTAPTSNGGAPIVSYTATSSPGGITAILTQSGSGTITVTGLSPNTSYTFTLTAYNGAATSVASEISNSITTSASELGAPTIGTATSTGTTTATVSFTAPTADGGAPIVSYTATSSPGGLSATLTQSASGTITVAGLSPSTAYTFTVTAYNGTSTSTASSVSNSITTDAPPISGGGGGGGGGGAAPSVTAPDSPNIGTATATSSTTANVSFTAPVNNGGAAIVSYTATSSPGGQTATLTQSGSGTIIITGLSPNTSYTFTVTAFNGTSTSTASSASNSVTTNGGLTPQFGTAKSTSDGFTLQITNYNSLFTWSGSSSAGGSVSIDGSGLITVTNISTGISSTVTVGTSRSGYASSSATSSPVQTIEILKILSFTTIPTGKNVKWSGPKDCLLVITSSNGQTSESTISNYSYDIASPPPGISYTVSFKNSVNGVAAPDQFIFGTAPTPIADLTLIQVNAKSLTASWRPSSQTDRYKITVRPTVGSEFSITIADNKFQFDSSPNSSYTFSVVAVGALDLESSSVSSQGFLKATQSGLQHLALELPSTSKALSTQTKQMLQNFVTSLWSGSIVQCTGKTINPKSKQSGLQISLVSSFNVCAYMQSLSPTSFFSIPTQMQSIKQVPGKGSLVIVDVYISNFLDQIRQQQKTGKG